MSKPISDLTLGGLIAGVIGLVSILMAVFATDIGTGVRLFLVGNAFIHWSNVDP